MKTRIVSVDPHKQHHAALRLGIAAAVLCFLLAAAWPITGQTMGSPIITQVVGTGVPPLLTTAAAVNSGIYPTRDWVTEKHAYSPTGVPSAGVLVRVEGVKLSSITNGAASGDCNDSSSVPPLPPGTWCDSTADGTDSTGTIHLEIDQVYKALGIAPPDWPTDGSTLNIEGYTFFDGEGGGQWEIHPITAWNLASGTSLKTSFSFSPAGPSVNTPVQFTATPTGGVPPYSISWDFGDGSTGAGASVIHTYTTAQSFSVTVTVTDSASPQASVSVSITVNVQALSPLTLTVPGNRTVTTGAWINFTVTPTDLNPGRTITLSTTTLPANATFDPSTGVFSWKPSSSQTGYYTITFTATDDSTPPMTSSKPMGIQVNQASPGGSGGGGSGGSSNGGCLLCGTFPTISTSMWLLMAGGLLGFVASLALLTIKARANLEHTKRRLNRLTRED